jgi:acetyl-CoA carboxylase biotin carboxylase subunit
MQRVLVANRGEIALRAIRACRQLGHQSLAVFSSADASSPHRWAADHAICIGPPSATASYLNVAALLETATAMKCDAIYPGYGFLAENSAFVERCNEAGLTFIGPDSDCISRMGDKVAARRTAAAIGIPVVPGSDQGFTDANSAGVVAADLGLPLLLKASGGGGGRGMRVVTGPCELCRAVRASLRGGQSGVWKPGDLPRAVLPAGPPYRDSGIRRSTRQSRPSG